MSVATQVNTLIQDKCHHTILQWLSSNFGVVRFRNQNSFRKDHFRANKSKLSDENRPHQSARPSTINECHDPTKLMLVGCYCIAKVQLAFAASKHMRTANLAVMFIGIFNHQTLQIQSKRTHLMNVVEILWIGLQFFPWLVHHASSTIAESI